MQRRKFFKQLSSTIALGALSPDVISALATETASSGKKDLLNKPVSPRAITMWDFSWLERRWDGAGYEDWDIALDELAERGYNAVRIDAYPHLVAKDPHKKWTLHETWNQQVWGSPDMNIVQVQPALNEFLDKCRVRDIKVGLSTWYRKDVDDIQSQTTTPQRMAEDWLACLQTIQDAGLMDTVLYVDFCNEWPAPKFFRDQHKIPYGFWFAPESIAWMKETIEIVRKVYPDMPLLFSFDNNEAENYRRKEMDFLDLYEPHIWMVQQNNQEFYKAVGYNFERFDPIGYKNVVAKAEKLYREKPEYWQKLLVDKIQAIAQAANEVGRPLITTECWGIIDYKDWPLLDWGWVKELCALGTITASQTKQWAAISTSNFCGPQFVGMWRDIEWHQRLTSIIRKGELSDTMFQNQNAQKLLRRL